MSNVSLTKPDHLVVIAQTLREGIEYVADSLRAAPVPLQTPEGVSPDVAGARLSLWNGLYIDVATISREVAEERSADACFPRPYGLDSTETRLRAAHGPFLAHWVARVERPRQLKRWAVQYPRRLGTIRDMQHARRAAHATMDASGAFPAWRGAGDGLLPTLIQWNDATHPTASLPESGIALKALRGFHPSPELIGEQLRWLGLETILTVEPTLVEPSMFAEFETPSGIRTLK